jgi:dihydrofolate reductase
LRSSIATSALTTANGTPPRVASQPPADTDDFGQLRPPKLIDVPIFVVTHKEPTEGEWSPRVSFVTDGVERAVELAKEVAGDREVSVCAANTAQQLLRIGLLDEIDLSVVPCLLGSGVRLFDHLRSEPINLEQIRDIPSDGVTHVRYRVVRS